METRCPTKLRSPMASPPAEKSFIGWGSVCLFVCVFFWGGGIRRGGVVSLQPRIDHDRKKDGTNPHARTRRC